MEHTTTQDQTHLKTKKVKNNNLGIITGAIILAAAIIYSFAGNKYSQNANFVDPDTVFVDPDTIFSGRELKQEEFMIGNKNRKVVLVEYSDLECPFCKKFHVETMEKIYSKYKDSIGIAYRHFPLSIHKKAPKESEATLCVRSIGGNDTYKAYITKIFETTNGNDSLEFSSLEQIAKDLGVDRNKWNTCMASSTYTAAVQEDLTDGLEVGVQGTPNTFVLINEGREYKILTVINGARDEKYVSNVIDQALKMAK